jgi:benzoate 4-monooxygenase
MAVVNFLSPYTIPIALLLFYLVPYFTSNTALRDIPGPVAAKFTNLWLLLQARQGKRYQGVDEKARQDPHHVSIADESTIPIVYGHGNGFLKSSVAPIGEGETLSLMQTVIIMTSLSVSTAAFSILETAPSTHGSARQYRTPSL